MLLVCVSGRPDLCLGCSPGNDSRLARDPPLRLQLKTFSRNEARGTVAIKMGWRGGLITATDESVAVALDGLLRANASVEWVFDSLGRVRAQGRCLQLQRCFEGQLGFCDPDSDVPAGVLRELRSGAFVRSVPCLADEFAQRQWFARRSNESLAPSSRRPSALPSLAPSALPSGLPSEAPTGLPSLAPTGLPSSAPTGLPSSAPTGLPSSAPTAYAPVDEALFGLLALLLLVPLAALAVWYRRRHA